MEPQGEIGLTGGEGVEPHEVEPLRDVLRLADELGLQVRGDLRVTEEEEYEGVDLAECGMEAYPEFMAGKSS